MPRTPFIGVRISWLMVARKPDLARLAGFGLVARFGDGVFQRLALGDVAPDALHFDQAAGAVAHRVIFPGDPAPAIGGADMLVVAHAGVAGLQAREAAEQRRAAVGMQFGREGPADGALRVQAEQLEEGVVAIGQPAVRARRKMASPCASTRPL